MHIPVDTMPYDESFNVIGHVSSRIRYDGSRSHVSHMHAGDSSVGIIGLGLVDYAG